MSPESLIASTIGEQHKAAAFVDLDGVVWLSGSPIGKPARAVELLREEFKVIFVTNNAVPLKASILERLRRCDITVEEQELVTAAEVLAQEVSPGDRVLSLAGPGVTEALEARGASLVGEGSCEFVVVGWTDQFSYDLIAKASRAIRSGARFLATNLDPTHPTPEGLFPGSGAFVAAVSVAAEQDATVCGKPSPQMIAYLRHNYGQPGLVVGDRLSTDGELAAGLGVPFLFVDGGTEAADGHESHLRGATLEEAVEGWRQSRG